MIIEAAAPEALIGLPTPDAVFIGGGGGHPDVLDAATRALRPRGRLVANAVTVTTEGVKVDRHTPAWRELFIAIYALALVGGETIGAMAMPVTQWVPDRHDGDLIGADRRG